MNYLGLCVLVVSVSACASRSDRVVARAGEGLGYDAYYHPTPGGDPKTLQFLHARAVWLGVDVQYRPVGHEDLRGATGLSYTIDGQRVVIVAEGSINGQLEVLAHEVGHIFQPPLATRMEHEVFAELVSVEVCRRLGVDTSTVAARYLQANKSALSVARSHRAEIAFVVDILTRGFRK